MGADGGEERVVNSSDGGSGRLLTQSERVRRGRGGGGIKKETLGNSLTRLICS